MFCEMFPFPSYRVSYDWVYSGSGCSGPSVMYFFTNFLEQKYTTPGKNKSILPFYNFILLTELGAYRLKHMTENKYL